MDQCYFGFILTVSEFESLLSTEQKLLGISSTTCRDCEIVENDKYPHMKISKEGKRKIEQLNSHFLKFIVRPVQVYEESKKIYKLFVGLSLPFAVDCHERDCELYSKIFNLKELLNFDKDIEENQMDYIERVDEKYIEYYTVIFRELKYL